MVRLPFMDVNSPVDLLRWMVGHDTVNTARSGDPYAEQSLCEGLEAIARSWGLSTRRLAVEGRSDQLLIQVDGAGGEANRSIQASSAPRRDEPGGLLFESHLDTVAVDGMTIDPFAGEVRDGRLYGRGACDTKGTGAAMLWALRRYAQRPALERPRPVALLFTIDEESGMSGVRALLRNDLDKLPFQPRGVVVGEATRLRPVVAHHGVLRWRVSTTGVAAHSADPSKGRSAITAMRPVLEEIEDRYIPSLDASHPRTGVARASVNLIRGGSLINIIPESCSIEIDRRVAPGETLDEAEQSFRKRLAAFELTIERTAHAPPLADDANRAWADAVVRTLDRIRNADEPAPTPCGVAYATHAGDLAEAGLPVVVLGPGDIAQAHTHDEFIALDAFERGVEIYHALMAQTD